MKKFVSGALILLLALSLAACGSDSEDKKKDKDEDTTVKKEKPVLPICPQVAILHELDRFDDYGTEKPDPDQLVAQVVMRSVDGDCAYRKDGIDITFDLSFVGAKGPRLGGLHANFPYFIAIVDPNGNILSKERLTLDLNFSSSSKMADRAESLHVFIPLAKDKRRDGPDYQVLAGFQLTKEQLETLRSRFSD